MARSNGFRLGRLLGSNITIQADKIAADAVGGGSSATAYATAAALPLSGNTTGDQAFVSETGRLYIWIGTGWYNIALINTNPTITSGANASYSLSKDGTPTVLTLVANDPEGIPITWSYSVTTGSLTNGGGTSATVTQVGNEFTITPTTNQAYAGDFDITFTASDGVNISTSTSSITLSFATVRYENLGSTSSTANTGTGEGIIALIAGDTASFNNPKGSIDGAYQLAVSTPATTDYYTISPAKIETTINGAITFEYWCYLLNHEPWDTWKDLGGITTDLDTTWYKLGMASSGTTNFVAKQAHEYNYVNTSNIIQTWMHIAMCCDATSTKYYRNGIRLTIPGTGYPLTSAPGMPAGNVVVSLPTFPGRYQDIKVTDAFIYRENFVPTARTLA